MAEEIFQRLAEKVIAYDKKSALEAVQKGIEMGLNADEMVRQGLLEGIKVVCDKMKRDAISVAECVWSIDAFYESLRMLSPHLLAHRIPVKERVVLGVVEGDIHDIGKDIVGKMMEIANFEVYDLGRDVPVERFVEKALEVEAKIIALSTLMTTTMKNMRKVIELLENQGLRNRFKVIVGGTPVTGRFAEDIGADGYGENAVEAVDVAKALLFKSEGE